MISFLKRRNRSEYEGTVWGDLKAIFTRSSINWWALLGALAVPGVIAVAFIMEKMEAEYQEPEVFYVTQYAKDRSLAEIKAQQVKDEAARAIREAEDKKEDEARKAEFRKLGQLFGMDVDNP